ncbi:BTAD domain-containing putative transcriptional regulator [Actinoallomurus soli]|uniref:BTAD domain-containing putative transcriptional regulator n=1 Tax=Actinoallomurus soli TaxID=2952535 RepID=UPI002093A3A9|nr:BTAD domain-containing putative transcriptional regulator [Actinoallomurus soli]MCO5970663.1 winged helix-turn-helix domain-containing protein [Actinoallomurus soli]
MRISLLGPLEVTDDAGRPVEVGGARLRALLILLALEAPRVLTADRLVAGVWDGDPPAGAPNALQSLISRLRRTLPGAMIDSRPAGYRLVVEDDVVDIRCFDRLVAHGRRLLHDDPARAADALAEALSLWRGTPLADVADTDFARGHVSRLAEQRLAAVEDHAEALLALGRADPAELEALVAAHPLRERLRGQYMRALCAAGRQADALATFEDARRTLAEELGVDPSPDLRAVHLAVLRGEQAPARSRGRHNLPARLTSFIGREEEIERVGKLLEENRLVTLTGPGGAGKTRLAVEAAAGLTERMPGGVWLIELAGVGDPGEVPQALLHTLGLREAALTAGVRGSAPTSVEPVERLVAALADERLLILLDNCEHLIDSCARLVDRVLADCPGVRVLATSRESLGIIGESLWPVPPLAFPPEDPVETRRPPAEPGRASSLRETLGYPAVRLFVERGTAVRPGFDAAADLPAVQAICRRLDGMPLAIELAAARLRTMTAAQLADRLDDRFRLLTGGSRTALPRHQTLRAVVDWSWDLLDEPERTLLRRLSVFAGGATLESIEDVCGGDVLDALTGLVEKSLVEIDATGRYRVLETIRAYGAERLSEAGEAQRIRRAHAHHFLGLAETAEPRLRTRDQLRWLDRLTAEYDNLHSALRWAIEIQDAALALRYVAALGWFWLLRGMRLEGQQLAGEALAVPGRGPIGAYAAATIYWLMGKLDADPTLRDDDVWRRIDSAMAACAAIPPDDLHPMLRVAPLGLMMFDGRIEEALTALDALREARDPWLRAAAETMRGHALINLGRVGEIDESFTAALDRFRALGERWGMSLTLTGLAELTLWRGDPLSAKDYIEEALRYSLDLGSFDDSSHLRVRLAHAFAALGEDERARAELDAALRGAERRGSPMDIAVVRFNTADVARRRGDLDVARAALEDLTLGEWVGGPPQFASMINTQLGMILGLEGDLDAALARHVQAFRYAWLAHDAPIIGQAVVGLADHALRSGDPGGAALLLGASVGIRGAEDRSLADPPRIERAVREAIGDERYAEAYARGHALRAEDVAERLGIDPITDRPVSRPGAATPPA